MVTAVHPGILSFIFKALGKVACPIHSCDKCCGGINIMYGMIMLFHKV